MGRSVPTAGECLRPTRIYRYEDVVTLFDQHDVQTDAWPVFNYFYAMALFQVGRVEKSLENLRLANDKLDQFLQHSFLKRPRWWHLAMPELLRDEAEALIRDQAQGAF